jgi:hypothetical protein
MVALEGPGGESLGRLLGAPTELDQFLRLATAFILSSESLVG